MTTYTKLKDGSWGIKGKGLTTGQTVSVTKKSGECNTETVSIQRVCKARDMLKTTLPYGPSCRPDVVAARLAAYEREENPMKLYEVILSPSVLESQSTDVELVRAASILAAAKKFAAAKKIKLGPQVREFEPGPRGTRAAFRAAKDWKMFGGLKHYELTVTEARVL